MPSNEQLRQIIAIQTRIAKFGLDLVGVMQYIVDQAPALTHGDGAAIELREGEDMVYRAVSGIAADQLGLRIPIKTSLSGLSLTSGEAIICNDCDADQRVDLAACRKTGLRSMLLIPLKHEDITVGVMKSMATAPNKFSATDTELMVLLSEVVAASMYYASTYDRDALFYQATHDSLTGLANRALFMDRLRSAIAHAERDQYSSGVLIIDMDGLKAINDTWGHRAGDAALAELARLISQATRNTDTVARLGGDEFGVILTPFKNPAEAEKTLARIRRTLQTSLAFEGHEIQLRASIGAAYIPHDGTDPNHIIQLADERMYTEKRTKSRSL